MKFCVMTKKRKYICNRGIDACLFLSYDLRSGESVDYIIADVGSDQPKRYDVGGHYVKDAQIFINQCESGSVLIENDLPDTLISEIESVIRSVSENLRDYVLSAFSIVGRVFLELGDISPEYQKKIQFLLHRINWVSYGLYYDPAPQCFDCRRTIGYTVADGHTVPVNLWGPLPVYERLHYFGGQYPTSANHTLSDVIMDGITKKSSYQIGDDVLFGDGKKWMSGIIQGFDGVRFTTDGVTSYPSDSILCLYEGSIPDLDFLIGAEEFNPRLERN